MGLDWDASGLFKGLAEHEFKMWEAVQAYAETAGMKCEAHAKKNRPWEDRTGNAKNSIQGGAENHGNSVDVYVSGNTDYFPFLELAREKQYATLWPTIEELGPEILQGMKNLLSK